MKKGLISLIISLLIISLNTTKTHALPTGWSTSTVNGMEVINDTTNNLQWLSPTNSINISYDDMVLNLSNSLSMFFGFEYATSSQTQTLFQSYGLVTSNSWNSSNVVGAQNIQTDFGLTHTDGIGITRVAGITGTLRPGTVNVHYTEQVLIGGSASHSGEAFVTNEFNFISDDQALGFAGSWLVNSTPVPEPGTLIMLGSGLAVLCILRKKISKDV